MPTVQSGTVLIDLIILYDSETEVYIAGLLFDYMQNKPDMPWGMGVSKKSAILDLIMKLDEFQIVK
jgi:hypothetical protein